MSNQTKAGLTLPQLPPPPEVPRMTRQEFVNLYEALERLNKLRLEPESSLIVPGGLGAKPNKADDIAGLTHYLAENLIRHGPEILSCWIAVRDELEPLCNVLTRLSMRVQTNLDSIKAR